MSIYIHHTDNYIDDGSSTWSLISHYFGPGYTPLLPSPTPLTTERVSSLPFYVALSFAGESSLNLLTMRLYDGVDDPCGGGVDGVDGVDGGDNRDDNLNQKNSNLNNNLIIHFPNSLNIKTTECNINVPNSTGYLPSCQFNNLYHPDYTTLLFSNLPPYTGQLTLSITLLTPFLSSIQTQPNSHPDELMLNVGFAFKQQEFFDNELHPMPILLLRKTLIHVGTRQFQITSPIIQSSLYPGPNRFQVDVDATSFINIDFYKPEENYEFFLNLNLLLIQSRINSYKILQCLITNQNSLENNIFQYEDSINTRTPFRFSFKQTKPLLRYGESIKVQCHIIASPFLPLNPTSCPVGLSPIPDYSIIPFFFDRDILSNSYTNERLNSLITMKNLITPIDIKIEPLHYGTALLGTAKRTYFMRKISIKCGGFLAMNSLVIQIPMTVLGAFTPLLSENEDIIDTQQLALEQIMFESNFYGDVVSKSHEQFVVDKKIKIGVEKKKIDYNNNNNIIFELNLLSNLGDIYVKNTIELIDFEFSFNIFSTLSEPYNPVQDPYKPILIDQNLFQLNPANGLPTSIPIKIPSSPLNIENTKISFFFRQNQPFLFNPVDNFSPIFDPNLPQNSQILQNGLEFLQTFNVPNISPSLFTPIIILPQSYQSTTLPYSITFGNPTRPKAPIDTISIWNNFSTTYIYPNTILEINLLSSAPSNTKTKPNVWIFSSPSHFLEFGQGDPNLSTDKDYISSQWKPMYIQNPSKIGNRLLYQFLGTKPVEAAKLLPLFIYIPTSYEQVDFFERPPYEPILLRFDIHIIPSPFNTSESTIDSYPIKTQIFSVQTAKVFIPTFPTIPTTPISISTRIVHTIQSISYLPLETQYGKYNSLLPSSWSLPQTKSPISKLVLSTSNRLEFDIMGLPPNTEIQVQLLSFSQLEDITPINYSSPTNFFSLAEPVYSFSLSAPTYAFTWPPSFAGEEFALRFVIPDNLTLIGPQSTSPLTFVHTLPFHLMSSCYTPPSPFSIVTNHNRFLWTPTCLNGGFCQFDGLCSCGRLAKGNLCQHKLPEICDCVMDNAVKCDMGKMDELGFGKCYCDQGWSGERCDKRIVCTPDPTLSFDKCNAANGNHFIDFEKTSEDIEKKKFQIMYLNEEKVQNQETEPQTAITPWCQNFCTCNTNWTGKTCGSCPLRCKNDGRPYKECDKCGCPDGFGGSLCQCTGKTIEFELQSVFPIVLFYSKIVQKFDQIYQQKYKSSTPIPPYITSLRNTYFKFMETLYGLIQGNLGLQFDSFNVEFVTLSPGNDDTLFQLLTGFPDSYSPYIIPNSIASMEIGQNRSNIHQNNSIFSSLESLFNLFTSQQTTSALTGPQEIKTLVSITIYYDCSDFNLNLDFDAARFQQKIKQFVSTFTTRSLPSVFWENNGDQPLIFGSPPVNINTLRIKPVAETMSVRATFGPNIAFQNNLSLSSILFILSCFLFLIL
jgi:hypothetical protein